MTLDLKQLDNIQKQNWLQHAVAPRPIGLVSTMNRDGLPNLAPFSFFNLVSTNPPILIFSPNRRVRDNTVKDSFMNLYDCREVVINIVTEDMLQQVNITSCDYPPEVDEFQRAGFTKEPATMVRPFMVMESPVRFECRINEIKPLGKEGGAGNLIIAEALCMHVSESILNEEHNMIAQEKLKLVARLGGPWYCRVNSDSLFKLPKPGGKLAIGMEALPPELINSKIFSPNELAYLASVDAIPEKKDDFFLTAGETEILHHVKRLLQEKRLDQAWQLILNLFGAKSVK